jgi:hypothetical protein
MAKQILKNVRIFWGAADLTAQSNKVELNPKTEELNATTFGSVDAAGELWKEVASGLDSAEADVSGFWWAGDPSQVDDNAFSLLGSDGPLSILPTTSNPGDLAWLMKAMESAYTLGGQVGELAPYSAHAVSNWPLVRGAVLNAPGLARTATGSGSVVQLGAVAAAKAVYAALHFTSVAGTTPSITVRLQSAAAVGFASPTTRATFTAANAQSHQILRAVGPITDAYWRLDWTITGTTPSFLFLGDAGIG